MPLGLRKPVSLRTDRGTRVQIRLRSSTPDWAWLQTLVRPITIRHVLMVALRRPSTAST